MSSDSIPSLDSWREANNLFERLVALDEDARNRELHSLQTTRPDLFKLVDRLLHAGPATQAQALLNAEAVDMAGVAGAIVGDYQLQTQIGAGGMGEVWLARRNDGLYKGQAAVKLLHPYLSSSRVRGRFAREGQILGRLSHPHIARLLDAGIGSAGALYLVLEHVPGKRIDFWCSEQRLDVPARLRLFLQVCEAVAYAHGQLVVHRDLKPSNILVTSEGETKLLDFGIAKLLEQEETDAELTRLGGVALTPEYASPEQLAGEPVTTATDVYSLGLLLYLLLAGRHPFAEHLGNPIRFAQAVRENDAPLMSNTTAAGAPPQLARSLRGDLDNIVARALRRQPDQRYPSAQALADDIQRYLNHEPVLARPESFGYRSGKFLRRHWLGVSASTAIAASLIIGITGTIWQARRAEHQAEMARAETLRAKQTKQFFVSLFQSQNPEHRSDESPMTLEQALDLALKRLDEEFAADPRLQGDLLNDFGEIRAGTGDLAGAKAMFHRALPLHEKSLAPDDPALANTLVNMGTIEAYMGSEMAGKPYLERAVAILAQHAETEGDALSNARTGLANIYSNEGRDAEALAEMEKILEFYRREPGEKELRLGIALANMGTMLAKVKRIDEAESHFKESIIVAERNMGSTSILQRPALNGLMALALDRNDLKAAAEYADRHLEVARANISEDHAWLAHALGGKGEVLMRQQQRPQAEKLLREALAILERVQSSDGEAEYRLLLAESRALDGDHAEVLKVVTPSLTGSCAERKNAFSNRSCDRLKILRDQALARTANRSAGAL